MCSLIYAISGAFLIISQGLFGESFIAIILGLPWMYFMVSLKFPINPTHPFYSLFLYLWIFTPIFLNVIILYFLGAGLEKFISMCIKKTRDSELAP